MRQTGRKDDAPHDPMGQGLMRPILTIVGIGNLILFCGAIKLIWPEAPSGAFLTASVLGVIAAAIEIEIVARTLGRGPIFFDWELRATKMGVAGLALGLGLCLFLTISEVRSRPTKAEQIQETARQETFKAQNRQATEIVRKLNQATTRQTGQKWKSGKPE